MRGLKLSAQQWRAFDVYVASFTDAWIETKTPVILTFKKKSHLLQMRGLKLLVVINLMMLLTSHLLQMRGLKRTRGKDKPTP